MSRALSTGIPRFAFVGWNPFQLRHACSVARCLPNSVFLVEKRKGYVEGFAEQYLDGTHVPTIVWPRQKLPELDGIFDVMVCQTMFTQIERFTRTKIAMLQYGLAKESHNYDAWRSLGHLQLAYGPYSAARLRHYGPVEVVGNPALDRFHDATYLTSRRKTWAQRLRPDRKTITYVPTWGELSTSDLFIEAVVGLSKDYNVILKLHHNTALLEADRKRDLEHVALHVLAENDDLLDALVVSDLVLSDYSGAIFDALYCGKPVLLLQDGSDQRFGAKLDTDSLEHARRDDLGTVVATPSVLRSAVSKALRHPRRPPPDLMDDLILSGPGASERAASALMALAKGEVPAQSQTQAYVRRAFVELRMSKSPGKKKTRAVR